MEIQSQNDRQRWVNLSYIVAAVLVGYIVLTLAIKAAAVFDLEARVSNIDLIIRGGSVAIGAILFFVLYSSDKVNQYMHEVVVELSRVTWPTSSDTSRATIVVMIMVLISGLALGGMDSFWTWVIKMILG